MLDRRGPPQYCRRKAENLILMVSDVRVTQCTQADVQDWIALRHELWPFNEALDRDDVNRILANEFRLPAFIARDASGNALGFAEASLRHDYVNGCDTSPVLFLEGIYVHEPFRRRGVARALCDAVAGWGRAQGCTEFASDAEVANLTSHAMHRALGFEETERVVYFRKSLASDVDSPTYASSTEVQP